MRIANLAGRLTVLVEGRAIDVHTASRGAFSADPQAVYARWAEFRTWAAGADLAGGRPVDVAELGAPAPSPRQIFAIGLNYREHVSEAGFTTPEGMPPVFTKYATALTGPVTEVRLPQGGHTDWEAELVAVIGHKAHNVSEADAWSHVAGLTVGQDISERVLQMEGPAPQFSLGKSYPGFAPTGPWLVTPDEFDDPDDLELTCSVNGEVVQHGHTRQMIFSVPALVAKLSGILPLLPGDVIFTGTPAGVGLGRTPQRWLAPGDELLSSVVGIGELRQRCAD
ncbi:fumarylacetoacetate hydrolase family protein [Streptomyces sp. TRM S81-3]|uniref:Fumarylacetoacetate hydrolase family protein n=1 Tax=Streptomyces griseicoloratus TaxID=2752516 RepID=A0A926KZ77_9ACTN|nr:fumarylacetoacetate hydrolase family protein [Streptomyces griseicoloratus]MBD0418204.1 fumarylacetoacetate hydrolase family protein [Streptomyces griseicoloratus]